MRGLIFLAGAGLVIYAGVTLLALPAAWAPLLAGVLLLGTAIFARDEEYATIAAEVEAVDQKPEKRGWFSWSRESKAA